MTKGIKIATIGGGSSYTPELMEGFIKRYEELPIREIWLVDIEAGKEKLAIVGAMAQRMWDASPYDVKIHMTLDREEALKDADFVTTQFRVGLLNARIKDERIPAYYGMIGQETNGPGGMFKAFRTVPIILEIVEDMKRLCPNAWLINFANPSGMVTEAVVRYGKWDRVIGLCNVPVMATMIEPALIGKEPDELIYKFAGLNHFHWHKVTDSHGNDVTMDIIDKMYQEDNGLPKNIFDVPFYREQLEQMRMIPCGYHRYYYRQEEMLKHALEEYQTVGTRAQQVKQTEAELLNFIKIQNWIINQNSCSNVGSLLFRCGLRNDCLDLCKTKIPRSWSQPKMRELFLTYRLIVLSKLPRMLGDKVPAMWLLASCRLQKKAGYK